MTNDLELMNTPTRIWERQPGETPKAYAAFCLYRDMPLFSDTPGGERSLQNVADKLGYAVMSGVGMWSSKYNWVERANAYDQWQGTKAITAQTASIEEFQRATITSLSNQLLVVNELIDRKLDKARRLEQTTDDENKVDIVGLKKLLEAIKIKDDLARRLSKLPTTYAAENAQDTGVENDEMVFIIGAD